MKQKLLTKMLLVMALLGLGTSAWADDITTLPFIKTWISTDAGDATSPFDAGTVKTAGNITALSVNNTTATAYFDSSTESDGRQVYTLATNEEVTVSLTAYHGWLNNGKTQGVKLINSQGNTIAEYVYNVGSCNITDVKIGGSTASGFTAAYNCQSTRSNGGTNGANGFTNNNYVTTEGYNPVITFTVRYDGYVTLNITQEQRSINNTYTGNLPAEWNIDIASIQAYASSDHADRTLAINNLSVTSVVEDRANYTVKYVDSDLNQIDDDAVYSGVVGSIPTLISADKAPRYNVGNTKKYVYASDDASSKTIAANGSTVVTITFSTYEKYDYSVTNSMGQTIDSGSLFEDETKVVSYPKYAQYNGAYYVTTTPYQTTVSNSNKTPVVSYSTSDVTQFVEATSSNWGTTEMSDTKYSGGVAYRGANSAKTMITAEETGVYKLTYAVCSNSTGTARTLYIYKNNETDENKLQDDLSVTWSLNYINSTGFKTIDNINLNAGDAILFKGSDTNIILDYVALSLKSVSKTITDAGWATYCSPYALDLQNATGLTDAYIVTGGADGVLAKTSVKGGTVPANTGLLLKGSEGTVTIPVAASSSTDVSGNKLVGVTTETAMDLDSDDDGTADINIYVLMNDATNGLGFYQTTATSFTLGANTAYLPANFTDSVAGARSFFSLFNAETTGIEDAVKSKEIKDKIFYNLSGQRVKKATKGLYIVNGKKYVK